MNEEINELSKKLTNAVDFSIDNLDQESLIKISNEMGMLIKQSQFWIDQGDSERYFYDVKNFLTWLCDYVAMQNNDNFCE